MRSLVRLAVVGGVLGVNGAVLRAPAAEITPAPRIEDVEWLVKRQDPDAVSLAEILLTAIPASLRQIAATNIPAVSSILWEEFLDDNRPEWFLELPEDVQSYLIRKFGPKTAEPTEPPASSDGGFTYPSATVTDQPAATSQAEPSGTSDAATGTATGPAESSQTAGSTASGDSSSFATLVSTGSTRSTATHSLARSITSSINLAEPSSTSTDPNASSASNSGLSKNQKIGLGVGIPFAILGAAALFFGCCTLLRRRKKKHVDGSVPPSSPGFIPRFAFQVKSTENLEHRQPLNRDMNHSTHDLGNTAWDDDGIDPMDAAPMHNPYTMNDLYHAMAANPTMSDPEPIHHPVDNGMTMRDAAPIMAAPALFHTHSSNRARGKRTSYTSLSSVAEMTEPDESESPVLGRHVSPKPSPGRSLIATAPMPAAAQIKRKPVAGSPPQAPPPVPSSPEMSASPAAKAASRKLLRQTMPDHSGSSSSGLGLSTSSGFNTSSSSGLGVHTEATSPISPVSNRANSNPFNYDTYVEDYGPEYHNGYVDVEDGLYGGHTSLSRYPDARRKSSRTEWPLRNMVGSGYRRKSSPLWDRIYEE